MLQFIMFIQQCHKIFIFRPKSNRMAGAKDEPSMAGCGFHGFEWRATLLRYRFMDAMRAFIYCLFYTEIQLETMQSFL